MVLKPPTCRSSWTRRRGTLWSAALPHGPRQSALAPPGAGCARVVIFAGSALHHAELVSVEAESGKVVPTWITAVHAAGTARLFEDKASLYSTLELTDSHEAGFASLVVATPRGLCQGLTKAISV